jgi:hypothetical protein
MSGGGAVGCPAGIGFAPVRIAVKAAPAGAVDRGMIEIEFATGARMRITGSGGRRRVEDLTDQKRAARQVKTAGL